MVKISYPKHLINCYVNNTLSTGTPITKIILDFYEIITFFKLIEEK